MRNVFISFLSLFYLNVFGQTQQHLSSGEILAEIQKLKSIGSILYIAAHPDDENTRLLTYLANEKKVLTTYLSLTRGDGGQNLIGKEKGELLGLLRTQELLEARKIDGAYQLFTRAVDFGYSKTPEETFEKWNHDSVLYDVVWAIRNLKPDIIINRFPTTGEGGHGHHTASAILSEEAFSAAADNNKFPDQLFYVKPWQAKRLFWNTFNFSTANTIKDDQLKLNIGVFNTLQGKYYGEIAAESRSMHKSQGFGAAKTRGESIEYFEQIKGDRVEKDLFEGIVFNWSRYEETKHFNTIIDNIIKNFDPLNPSASVNDLIHFYEAMKKIKSNNEDLNRWLSYKMLKTEDVISACSLVWTDVFSSDSIVALDDSIKLSSSIIYNGNVDLATGIDEKDSIDYTALARNSLKVSDEMVDFPHEFFVSDPYWLRLPQKNNFYQVENRQDIGMPESPPVLIILHTKINNHPFDIKRLPKYKYVDPIRGEVIQPLRILPAVVLKLAQEMVLFPDEHTKKIFITVRASKNNVSGVLKVKPVKGWNIFIPNPNFNIDKNKEANIEVLITKATNAINESVEFYAESNGTVYDKMMEEIHYEHISPQYRLKKTLLQLTVLNIKKKGLYIGYIPGSGDDIATLLSNAGYNVEILDNEKLAGENITKYDAIISGIRAFNVNESLLTHFKKLLEYVKNGGNLIVQYNTNSWAGPLSTKISPYPFTISRNRVTDENSAIEFLQPEHAVLNYPNKILQSDFENWVQERGLYFATDIDKNFTTILSMKDNGEEPQPGSLIIAKYGKGNYVYTGLSFFRQLPAGVSGAYKLLANIIALPKNK